MSYYVEYLNLIDQTVDEDTADIVDEAPVDEPKLEPQKSLFDVLKEIVMKIINYIILNLSILKLR